MTIRSVKCLIEFLAAGGEVDYLFFWGHTPKIPGQVDASCLSNWYPAPFTIDGLTYATSEHYMMAEKARLFGDAAIREQIIAASSPGEAKQLGRQVADFDEVVWNERRFEIVVTGNLAKFSQHTAMGEFLLQTGNKILVEASPRDRIWGIGMGRNNENAENPSAWRGLNLLGFALMEVRGQLRVL